MQDYSSNNQKESKSYAPTSTRNTTFGLKKKRVCYFCAKNVEPDYKNVALLKNYISDKGKILPRRVTKTCAKHQRRVAKAIKRSRMVALLSFVDKIKE